MYIAFWIACLVVFLYVTNAIFYRLKGVERYQLPAQFPQTGKGIAKDQEIPESMLNGVERKWFDVAGGKIESWLLADNVKRSTLIFAHGNMGFIDTNLKLARAIQALGYHVLLVEYPGYGRSSGKPSEATLTEGFCQAYDWLKTLPYIGSIGAFGNSLGSGVVARLSNERSLDWLILKSGPASFAQFVAKKAFVPRWLVVNPFNTLKYVRAFQNPILILHGKADEVVAYENAIAIDKAAQNSEMVTFNGGHDSPNDEETLVQLKTFLSKYSS